MLRVYILSTVPLVEMEDEFFFFHFLRIMKLVQL